MAVPANRPLAPSPAATVGSRCARADPDPSQDDTFLWRAIRGRRRAVGGAPLLFLQGLGPQSTGRTRLQRLVQRLELLRLGRDHDVWVVGRRAPLSPATTIASLAEDRARAIRARFDQPIDVVGESTGGSIALQLALDHPDVVNRLILVSTAFRLDGAGVAAQRDVVRDLRDGRPRRAAGTMLAATNRRPIRSRLLRAAGFALGRAAVGRSDQDLILTIEAENEFDLRDDLVRVSTPTVLVGGGQDGYYSPDLFAQTVALMPDAVFIEYPEKGHLTVMTHRTVRLLIRDRLRPCRHRQWRSAVRLSRDRAG